MRRSSAASSDCRRSSAPATRRTCCTTSRRSRCPAPRATRASSTTAPPTSRSRSSTSATMPETRTKVMLNLANPAAAFRWWRLPADGVGLARMEFVVTNARQGPSDGARALRRRCRTRQSSAEIAALTRGYADQTEYFVDQLWRRASRASPPCCHPKPVIVRMSDFKTNEYAELLGGRRVRAAGGEPDDRLPRRVALLLGRATARASRWSAGRSAGCARRWASRTWS